MSFVKRLKIVGPGFLIIALLALSQSFSVHESLGWDTRTKLLVALHIMLGPLDMSQPPLSGSASHMLMIMIIVPMVLSHPVRPRTSTAIVSSIGLIFWLCSGLGFAFSGV